MAIVIPDQLPKSANRSEGRIFELLQRLPDDCIAYYEPVIGKRYPDFLLISPTQGLLVIEIKNWSINALLGGDSYSIEIKVGEREASRSHPVRQARDYMFHLMDFCRANLWCTPLLNSEGDFRGRFFFPFGHLAILSNITRDQLQKRNPRFSDLFPTDKVLTKDELDRWANNCDGHALLREFSRFFDPNWSFPPMLDSQIGLLRSIIHPEIRIAKPRVLRAVLQRNTYQLRGESNRINEPVTAKPIQFQTGMLPSANAASSVGELPEPESMPPLLTISEISLKTLDLEQELAARSIGSGHRLIFGVAGSGKTEVLISRARLLAKVAQKKVLLLCFNVTLCTLLAKRLSDLAERVTTRHFDGLASEHGVPRQSRQSNQKLGERLLQKLRDDNCEPVFDALLVDEAQDFDPSWFICAMELVRDPQNADILIVGDGNQGIYGKRRSSWARLGIRAQGRTTYLRKSYRSSKEIVRFAAPFASTEFKEDDGVSPIAIDPAHATRSTGMLPLLMRATNREDETRNVVRLVESLINGKWANKQLTEALHPSDIAVLVPAITDELRPIFLSLCDKLEQQKIPWLWLSNPADRKARKRIFEKCLKIQSVHSSKGLQYKAVIILWSDLLPNHAWAESQDEQRMLLYVALTRAEDCLAVSYSGDSPFVRTLINSGNAYSVQF